MAAAPSNILGVATTPRGTYSATEIMQAELHWGIRRVLQLLARKRPLMLVFEDLHWAEPTLIELVRYIAEDEQDAPILIVALRASRARGIDAGTAAREGPARDDSAGTARCGRGPRAPRGATQRRGAARHRRRRRAAEEHGRQPALRRGDRADADGPRRCRRSRLASSGRGGAADPEQPAVTDRLASRPARPTRNAASRSTPPSSAVSFGRVRLLICRTKMAPGTTRSSTSGSACSSGVT